MTPLRVLLAIPTAAEATPVYEILGWRISESLPSTHLSGIHLTGCITGPSVPFTLLTLSPLLTPGRFDLLLHLGIAGVREGTHALGSVVQVRSDRFGDIGAETADGGFLDLSELGLWPPAVPQRDEGRISPASPEFPTDWWPTVDGVTVNRIPGTPGSIRQLADRYDFSVESMEGAAVFLAAIRSNLPCLAIRGLSNHIEPRNRAGWQIAQALNALTEALDRLLHHPAGLTRSGLLPPGPAMKQG